MTTADEEGTTEATENPQYCYLRQAVRARSHQELSHNRYGRKSRTARDLREDNR